MRIIGEHTKDYYDTAGWADHSHIFHRVAYDEEKAKKEYWEMPFLLPSRLEKAEYDAERMGHSVDFGMCIVAGEVFPYAHHYAEEPYGYFNSRTSHYTPPKVVSNFIYDPDEANDTVIRLREAGLIRGGIGSFNNRADVYSFMRVAKDVLSTWCLDNRAVTGLLFPVRPHHYKDPHHFVGGMINCDGLGAHGLMKVLDPSAAHMRIDGYISGVLGTKHDVVKISDASRVRKAGFDTQSFRTRPGTRKPRSVKRAG